MTGNTWEDARNVLCIRLDSLGDVVMTTPAVRAVKAAHPERRITLLTSPAGALVAPLIPEVNLVISYSSPWMKATSTRLDSRPDLEMIQRLQEARFDAAVIFTVFSQNPLPAALMAYLAGIPLRLAHCRENPYQLLTDWVKETDREDQQGGMRHEVRRQLDLVAAVGCHTSDERLSIRPPAGARSQVEEILSRLGVDLQQPWLVLHPGASAPSRRYRPDGFAAAARSLVVDHGFQIVFTGTAAEAELIEQIQAVMGAASFSAAGQLDLGQLAALLEISPLLISNNTGPVHLAAALGTPVVDLYALTNPQHTPWGVPHRVLYHDVPCKYCYKSVCPLEHHRCLRLVPPEAVVAAALELLPASMDLRGLKESVL